MDARLSRDIVMGEKKTPIIQYYILAGTDKHICPEQTKNGAGIGKEPMAGTIHQ
jgi:hypothetical protein